MSTPEPPSVLKSAPILHPACACSQTEMWTNRNALVSFPTGDTLLTTLLSRRHSATPRVAAGQSLRQLTSHIPPPGPMPSHCPHREPRHGCVAKSGSEKRPLSLIQLWEFLSKYVGRFPSFMPTSARHLLFLPPKGSRRLDGCSWNGSQGSPQPRHQGRLEVTWDRLHSAPREILPTTSKRLPPHPHPTESLCSFLSCCPRPSTSAEVTALMGRKPLSAPHPTAQAVGGCKTL